MPDETRKFLYEIEARAEGKDALEQLLEAIKKVEQAVLGMGEKFDAAMQRIVEPINGLTSAVDKLTASVGVLDTRLGQAAGLDLLGQKAKQAQIDLADLDRTLERYRVGTTRGYKLPGRLGGMFQSREQMIERYMLGQFGGGGMAETVSAPSPTAAPGTTALTYRNIEELQKRLGLTSEQTAAVQQQVAAEEELVVTIERLSGAEEQLAASTGRAVAEQLRQQANWEQMVVAGERVAEQLRRQSTELTRRAGAAGAARLREGRPEVIGQAYREAGWDESARIYQGRKGKLIGEGEDPKRALGYGVLPGDPEKEAEQMRVLEAAIGRKIVVQKLMARGSRDVAERFEKQFTVTRSKEEILREINRTGKMTTEMEKELGLQTERTGQQARKAGGMMRYFGRYLLRYLILWQGIQAVRGISKAWFAAHLEMADAVADFGWRVNATAEDVGRYRDKLRDVSTMVGMPVGQITSPLAGQATEAELLRAAEASKVFGGSVEDWLRTLQKGDVTLDAFAHGLRISTLATEDYAKLIGNASGIAKEFNITQAEAIGLLSVLPSILQAGGEEASTLADALTGLYEQNQLLMTLGIAPAVTVGPGGAPQRRPMPEMLAEIGRQPIAQQRQLAIAIGLTDQKYQDYFLGVVAGHATIDEAIRGTVDATGDMEDAIDGADESMKAHVESMKMAWSSLLETIGSTEAFKSFLDNVAQTLRGLRELVEGERPLWGPTPEDIKLWEEYLETLTPEGQRQAQWQGAEVDYGRWLRERERAETMAGKPGEPRGAGVAPPGPEPEPGPPPAYFPPMPTLRMGAGQTIGQLAAEMERVIDDVFTRPYTTASGEVIQVTKEQIDALRKNTVILDETGEAIGLLNVYAPALALAQENLKTEVQQFNLERLKDVTPEEFERAKREILPGWEARLGAVPGFEEQEELHNFFVGMNDTFMQMLGTETAISYTLQDILDVEKDQLEGMWNIPTGVTMRVPLQSLDLMRWMKGAGGGMPTDMMPTGDALETAANAQDNAAMAMHASANAQTAAAQVMTAQKQIGLEEYMTWAEAERLEYAAREPSELKQTIHTRRPVAGGAGKVVPMAPTGMPTGTGMLTAQFAINLVSQLFLDKKIVAEVVQTELSRRLVNTARSAGGGGSSGGLRP